MRRLVAVAAFVLFTGCQAPGAGASYDMRWVGTAIPRDQVACGQPAAATLTRRGDTFTFTPNDGVLIITGTVGHNDHVHGDLVLTGADHRPFPLTLDGVLEKSGFRGLYTTPRCQFDVTLAPPPA